MGGPVNKGRRALQFSGPRGGPFLRSLWPPHVRRRPPCVRAPRRLKSAAEPREFPCPQRREARPSQDASSSRPVLRERERTIRGLSPRGVGRSLRYIVYNV